MMTFRERTHRPVAQLFASWMRTAPLLEKRCLWRRFARETKRNKSVFYAEQNDNFDAALTRPVNTHFIYSKKMPF
jgi:hypothetical protein